MIYTIRVASKRENDSHGTDLLAQIEKILKIDSIKKVRTAKVYRLEGIDKKNLKRFVEQALFEPIDQIVSYDGPVIKGATQTIEVAYKPGVMNPEVASILKAAKDMGIKISGADSSHEFVFFGKIDKNQAKNIVRKLRLYNPLIEQIVEKQPKTFQISGRVGKTQKVPIRKMSDKQLMNMSQDKLFLNLEEMQTIKNYFKKIERDPTDFEVEVLAQTWSEHCGHKTFKASLTIDGVKKEPFIKRIKSTTSNNPKIIVSAFADNSGVIDFYDGFGINAKVETHNSPSAIEPYGGAMTGSGGVFRDVLGTGQGARVVASTDIFCLAPPDMPEKDIPTGCLPPDYLLKRVVAGIRDYGNPVGIPTNNGSFHFHKDFRAKPTVAAGGYGIIEKAKAQMGKAQKGDLIITIGGKTGRDGIHGATFSSGEMTAKTTEVSGTSVQIGNPIEEIRVIDATLAMSQANVIRAITDCGAGGFSSAVGEMAKNIGATVNLEQVPTKYAGLAPWEIFLSESQERMVLAISPKNIKEALSICKLYNVEATIFGNFDGSKRLNVFFGKQQICDISMEFLHDGLPQRKMVGKSKVKSYAEKIPPIPKAASQFSQIWKKIMSHGNICSKEPIVRMYDHTVQGTSVLQPLGGKDQDSPNDGAVIRPILEKPYGLVIAHGLNPALNQIDPYRGSVWAILEAVSNFVAIGGDLKDAALVDNFVWPFPDEESLADLDKSVDACIETAKILKMAFVSGKDSLSSTYRYPDGKILKIPPVLLISVFGKIPDVKKTISSDFKKANSTIVLVGNIDSQNLGGSTYFDVTNSQSANVPAPDTKESAKVLTALTKAIQTGKVLSTHDISEGGIAAAISEMCFGGDCGAKINLDVITSDKRSNLSRPDFTLFSETPATFLVEVEDEKTAKQLFSGVPYQVIGKTTKEKSVYVNIGIKGLCKIDVGELKTVWQKPMEEIFS